MRGLGASFSSSPFMSKAVAYVAACCVVDKHNSACSRLQTRPTHATVARQTEHKPRYKPRSGSETAKRHKKNAPIPPEPNRTEPRFRSPALVTPSRLFELAFTTEKTDCTVIAEAWQVFPTCGGHLAGTP